MHNFNTHAAEHLDFNYILMGNILKVYDKLDLIEVVYEVADDEALELANQIIEKYKANATT